MLCVALVFGNAATGWSQTVYNGIVSGEVLVKIGKAPRRVGQKVARADSGNRAKAAKVHARLRARVAGDFDYLGWQRIKLPPGKTVAQALKDYKGQPGILAAEPVGVAYSSATPNDARYGELWGMEKIKAPQAWELSTGSSDVVVAVVDTGVRYTHEDLAANMWRNPGESGGGKETNGVDDDGNGYVDDVFGIDPVGNDTNPMDDFGHGTHCSGTIGGVGNNAKGVAGVNWNVKIMALRAGNTNGLPNGALLSCYNYMLMMKTQKNINIRVANHSYTGDLFSQAIKDAFDALGNTGIINVCAAGNDSSNNDATILYPANFDSPNLISVAASDPSDNRASFSNYGAQSVDLAAPGVDILSSTTLNDRAYEFYNGTSMAAPHVAGAAALLAAYNPSLTAPQIVNRLLNTVDKLPQWNGKVVSGGRLNLAAALAGLPAVDVTLLAPADGATLSVGTYTIRATTTHNNDVARMDFSLIKNSGPHAGQVQFLGSDSDGPDGNGEFTFSATSQAAGSYLVRATAVFNDGSTRSVGNIVSFDVVSLSINDVTISEGNSGTANAVFTVTLNKPAATTVTVNYATANGTASGAANTSGDYQSVSSSLTFAPGEISKTIAVPIVGDTLVEPDETFFVNLSNATVPLSENQGTGIIAGDDVEASSLVVTTISDRSTVFDGVTSLREAINYANSNAGDDTIVFDASVFATAKTITLNSTQLPVINTNVAINGPAAGVTISGNFTSRVFEITAGIVSMDKLTISDGFATSGAGISNKGTLTLTNCTISDNTADVAGGGLYMTAQRNVTLVNCTLSNNRIMNSSSVAGIAIDNRGANLMLDSCTITNQVGSSNQSGIYSGTLTVRNSIVWGNGTADINFAGVTLVSQGYNLIGTSVGASFTGTGDQTGVADAKLGPLADNGGPTKTHALLADSPAVNAGNTTQTTDQRGVARPLGSADDIGAFELNSAPAAVNNAGLSVPNGTTATIDNTRLKYADNEGDAITFTVTSVPTKGTLKLNNVALGVGGTFTQSDIDNNLLSYTAGATIGSDSFDFSAADSVANSVAGTFYITIAETPSLIVDTTSDASTNTDTLTSLREAINYANAKTGDDTITFAASVFNTPKTITLTGRLPLLTDNVTITGPGAALLTVEAGHSDVDGDNYVIITSRASITSISGLTFDKGSALSYVVSGTATVSRCVVRYNGIGSSSTTGTLNVRDCFFDNTIGAVGVLGTLDMRNSTISGGDTGVNVAAVAARATLENVTITGTTTQAVRNRGTLTATNCTVSGNQLGVNNTGTATLKNSIVAGNTTNFSGTAITDGGNNITGGDPKLAALADNGGAVPTMALQSGSPALDAADDATAPATDARGISRPQGAHSDIGAFESMFVANTAPTASDQSVTTDEDTPKLIMLGASDGDNDTLTFTITQQPARGTLTNEDGSAIVNNQPSSNKVQYTPAANYPLDTMLDGSDSFKFKANDGTADSNVATVSITIAAVCDAPLSVGDSYSVNQDSTLTVAAPGVLLNDSELDGEALTAIKVSDPQHGTLTLNANGSFVYQPDAGFEGVDSFTYKASDGFLQGNTVTVSLTVLATLRVTSFTPAGGGAGTLVTVNGSGFSGVSEVQLNGASVGVFTVVGANKLTFVVPANATTGKISVITAADTATSSREFIVAPRLTTFSPGSGVVGSNVTVTGANLSYVTGARINGIPCAILSRSAGSLTFKVPEAASTGKISLSSVGGTVTSATDFVVLPRFGNFTPSAGGGESRVIINGSGFTAATEVRINGVLAPIVSRSASQLVVVVPLHATTGTVSVTTGAHSVTSTRIFTVLPMIVSFTPGSGAVGSFVTLSGSLLGTATDVRFNGRSVGAGNFNVVSGSNGTQLRATVPAGASTGRIAVVTPLGTASSAGSFTVTP